MTQGARKMDFPSLSTLAAGFLVLIILAALQWYLSGQAPRVSSTSQELLDLFEEVRPPPHTNRPQALLQHSCAAVATSARQPTSKAHVRLI